MKGKGGYHWENMFTFVLIMNLIYIIIFFILMRIYA